MLNSVDMTVCLLFILCDLTFLDDWWWWLHHQYCDIIKHASAWLWHITQCGMSTHSTSVFEQIFACELTHSTDMSTLVTICGILFIFLAVAEEKSLPWCMTVWNSGLLNWCHSTFEHYWTFAYLWLSSLDAWIGVLYMSIQSMCQFLAKCLWCCLYSSALRNNNNTSTSKLSLDNVCIV